MQRLGTGVGVVVVVVAAAVGVVVVIPLQLDGRLDQRARMPSDIVNDACIRPWAIRPAILRDESRVASDAGLPDRFDVWRVGPQMEP